MRLRFDTGRVERIVIIGPQAGLWSGLAVRRDGSAIVWTQEDMRMSDLMLITQ